MNEKKETVIHMLYVLEGTVEHMIDSADTLTEVKILENEIKRMVRRRLKLEGKI